MLSDDQLIDELRETFAAETSTIEPDPGVLASVRQELQRPPRRGLLRSRSVSGVAAGTRDPADAAGDDLPPGEHPRDRRSRTPLLPRLAGRLAAAGAVLAVIAVVAVVLVVSGHRGASTTPRRAVTVPYDVPGSARLAVLQRPQTAKDRTLPAVIRRAGRLAGLSNRLVEVYLSGIVASSMRYTQTLPDGREVFVALVHRTHVRQAALSFFIVAPDGSWHHGQPIVNPSSGLPDNRIARIEALHGGGCSANRTRSGSGHGLTVWSVEPNRVARVRWQFAVQDQPQSGGQPLTLDVPVRGNTAVATVPGFSSCEQPSGVTLYNREGQIIGSRSGVSTPSKTVTSTVPRSRVATTITARPVPARFYCQPRNAAWDWLPCNDGTPAGDVRTAGMPHQELVRVSFTARLAAHNRQSYYAMTYTNPGHNKGGGGGAASEGVVAAGHRITTTVFVTRSGRYTGSITYQPQPVAPRQRFMPSSDTGATLVGTFSFSVTKR